MADDERSGHRPGEPPPQDYPAEKARQGEVILRATWQRVIFFGGLVALVVIALIWGR